MGLNAYNSKMITIASRGWVTTSRGRTITPIRTPYREAFDRIWSMMTEERAEIYERLSDGRDIRLTVQNYDQDNTKTVEEKQEEALANTNPQIPAEDAGEVVPPAETADDGVKLPEEPPVENPPEQDPEQSAENQTPVEEQKQEEAPANTDPQVPAEDASEVVTPAETADDGVSEDDAEDAGDDETDAEAEKDTDANSQPQRSGKKKKNRQKNDGKSLEVPVEQA